MAGIKANVCSRMHSKASKTVEQVPTDDAVHVGAKMSLERPVDRVASRRYFRYTKHTDVNEDAVLKIDGISERGVCLRRLSIIWLLQAATAIYSPPLQSCPGWETAGNDVRRPAVPRPPRGQTDALYSPVRHLD